MASLFTAVAITMTMLLTGPVAAAQSGGVGATVTPYDQCVESTSGIRACTTGRVTFQATTTASGVQHVTMIDNGRFATVDSTTGCTRTGSYQLFDSATADPPEHAVFRNSVRTSGRIRCDDRSADTKCQLHVTTTILILPDEIRITDRVIRNECDVPA